MRFFEFDYLARLHHTPQFHNRTNLSVQAGLPCVKKTPPKLPNEVDHQSFLNRKDFLWGGGKTRAFDCTVIYGRMSVTTSANHTCQRPPQGVGCVSPGTEYLERYTRIYSLGEAAARMNRWAHHSSTVLPRAHGRAFAKAKRHLRP